MLILALLPVILAAQQSAHHGAPKYAPADGKKLLIIGQDLGAVGGLDAYSDGYVDHLGHVPAGVTTYTGFPGLSGLTTKANWGAGDVHAQAYIDDSTFDHSVIVIGLHLVDQLHSIYQGYSDYLIEELGAWIEAQARPVFLRIGYEFDGPWNHYDPEQYKQAWIYIVEYFDSMEIRNVAYVWQAYGGNTADIDRWYPGDKYVNWVGYSHFDEEDPGANINAFAEEHSKPVMIAEATPRRDLMFGNDSTHWAVWFDPLFEKIRSNDRIKALAYINVDWESQPMWQGGGWGDSRIQVSEGVEQNWREEIGKDQWILSSDSLFDILDYQLWQDSVTSVPELPAEWDQNLQLICTDSRLLVQSVNARLMDSIHIWDMNGRLHWVSLESSTVYEVPIELISSPGMVVIHVRMGDETLRGKAVLLN